MKNLLLKSFFLLSFSILIPVSSFAAADKAGIDLFNSYIKVSSCTPCACGGVPPRYSCACCNGRR